MKNIYLLAGWAYFFSIHPNNAAAQSNASGYSVVPPLTNAAAPKNITIVGDTCIGSTLTAQLNNLSLKELKWYVDKTLLEARSTWQKTGIIVASADGAGSGTNQLVEPYGVCIDAKKRIYVVDDGGQRVQRFTTGTPKAVTVAGGNGKGTAANQFYTPVDVIVDKDYNVYVSDDLAERVVKWAPGAKAGVTVAGGNGEGAGMNQFAGPQGICMDKAGNLYIADRWNDRVMKWAPGAVTGIVVAGGNGRGPAANQLDEPFGVGVDNDGNVYVTDPYNYRVQKWAPGATTGITVAGGLGAGVSARQFSYPSSITIDSLGDMYVLDRTRVLKWAKGSDYGITIAGGNTSATSTDLTGIRYSWGMCADNNGNCYVSAIFDGRVTKFVRGSLDKTDFTATQPGTYTALGTSYADVPFSAKHNIAMAAEKPQKISGANYVIKQGTYRYIARDSVPNLVYNWVVPPDATIISGQGRDTAWIKWGNSDEIFYVSTSNSCSISTARPFLVHILPDGMASPDDLAEAGITPAAKIYPNPSSNVASVLFTAKKQSKYQFTVTDMMGKVIYRGQGNTLKGANKIDIDVSAMRKSVYLVAIKYDDNTTNILKLNKE